MAVRSYTRLPDQMADNATKLSESYGLDIGRFIENEWFYGGADSPNSRYYRKRADFAYLNTFRTGDVDRTKFYDILNISQDKAWTAFDWSYYHIIPKFIDVIRDSFPIDIFTIKTEGIDHQTLTEKERFRYDLETEMLAKPFTEAFSMQTGIDFTPMGDIPETEAELDLIMEEYQESQEIAMEVCLTKIFDLNYWEDIYSYVIEDLITFGEAAVKNYPDQSIGIKKRRVHPRDLIYSFDEEQSKDLRGIYYVGEVRKLQIGEILKRSNGKFDEDQLRSMAQAYSGLLGNSTYDEESNDYDEYYVEVIEFCFKTTLTETYKMKYKKMVEKPDTWKLHPDSKSSRMDGYYDVWLEGSYIVGTDMIYDYRLMKDMIRSNKDTNRVLPPYIIYRSSTPSIVERMASLSNELFIVKQKIQQIVSTSKPQGNAIDLDALTDIPLGDGETLRVPDFIDIYQQKGDVFYSSRGISGERQGVPITPMGNGISGDLQQLITVYNQYLKMMYDTVGINPVTDGSAPTKGALKGVRQQALNASNTATRHILTGALSIMRRSCEVIVSRVQNMSLFGSKYVRMIKNLLGENNVDILMQGGNMHMYEYTITIDIAPDAEQREEFRATLDLMVQAGEIDALDRLKLMNTKNLKVAMKDLEIRQEKRRKLKQQEQMQLQQSQAQANAQSSIAVEQAKMQALQMQMQAKQAEIQFQMQSQVAIEGKKTEDDLIKMRQKFMYDYQLAQLTSGGKFAMDKYKEDRKDDRTFKQADQQSQLLQQRNNDSGAIPFQQQNELNKLLRQTPEQALQQQPDLGFGTEQQTQGDYGIETETNEQSL